MGDFFLRFDLPKSEFTINHTHKLTFLGSCFSDEISKKALESGFQVLSNPFGTIYNPISIAKNLLDALSDNVNVSVLKRDELYFSWDASTKISAKSESELEQLILTKNTSLKDHLAQPGFLFVTFGTALIYKLKEQNRYVANCHKQPSQLFKKELVEVDEVVDIWTNLIEKLQRFNPNLKIVFTVSPVRHIRDGIIENNRSKARLIQTVEKLTELNDVEYFPSYEIVIDELRDYRFFKEDRIHPSEEATKYIWIRFSDLYFDDQTKKDVVEIFKVRKRLAHRTEKSVDLDTNTLKSIQYLENQFPWVCWNVEK